MYRFRIPAFLAGVAIIAAACGGAASPSAAPSGSAAATAASDYPTKAIDIMAPAGPGGTSPSRTCRVPAAPSAWRRS